MNVYNYTQKTAQRADIGEIAHAELVAQENERNARKRNAKASRFVELIDEDQSGFIDLDELLSTQSNKRVIRCS